MIWFTSDHHFGHKNIIEFCNRPYRTIEEMDEQLISNWNERAKKNDTVYYLGDFTLGKVALKYIVQLNGIIKFIPGGHDTTWLRKLGNSLAEKHELLPALTSIKVPGLLVLCHYPLLTWEQSHYGSIHLHGHSHNTLGTITNSGDERIHPEEGGKHGKRMDVGVDAQNYFPISLDEVIERLL